MAGAQLFDPHCSTCHNLNAEQHGAGPHLVGVIGGERARSKATDFRMRSIRWTSYGRRTASRNFSPTTDPKQFAQARPCRCLALAKWKPAP